MKPCESGYHRPVPPPLPDACGGGFLMQRILAAGRLCRRPARLILPEAQFPCGVCPPFTVAEAGVCGPVRWEEIPCCRRGALALLCSVPVTLRLCDRCGKAFSVDTSAEEELFLQYRCPESEGWRGQIFLQAAIRPWRGCRTKEPDGCCIPVEMLLEGFLLSPCAVGCPERPPCPDPRPLYPQARFDMYGD